MNVAAPPSGFMYTDPVALQPRDEPHAAEPTSVDSALAARQRGLLEVRSVYDTDGLNRMGETMLTASDLGAGCTAGIAQTAPPSDPSETRGSVADIAKIKDPADPAYHCAPARFVRAVRVDAGAHVIHWRYAPRSVRLGAALSLLALAAFLIPVVRRRRGAR